MEILELALTARILHFAKQLAKPVQNWKHFRLSEEKVVKFAK